MEVRLLDLKSYRMHQLFLVLCFFATTFLLSAQVSDRGGAYKKELYTCLPKLSDSVFIKPRLQQELLNPSNCNATEVRYHSNTRSGELVQISIKSKVFLPSLHSIGLIDSIYKTVNKKKVFEAVRISNKIDSTYAYGVYGMTPATEVASFVILFNYTKIEIPKNAFSDLYNLDFCNKQIAPEVYIPKENTYFFVYLHGGEGDSQYFVKLIFDKKGYITRIINKQPCSKGFDFLDGIGNCE